ncbi:MAG TPA: TIGR03560 family F420-dependent LLM class oxidoreductase [Acidimicrobiia bacterium]
MPEASIPEPALVMLVGPSGAGKSTWAAAHFRPEEVVSSDRLRSLVGSGESDQDASADAFAILDMMVAARIGRRLSVVVDTLGLDAERRQRHRQLAAEAGMSAVLVRFDTPAAVCRQRNRGKAIPVPEKVLTSQLRRFAQLGDLVGEGWDLVVQAGSVELEPSHTPGVAQAARRQVEHQRAFDFYLYLSRFNWPGSPEATGERMSQIADAAEEAGFAGIAVMDHLLQIPQVGREWDDMLESYVTLGYLAAATRRLRIGALVTPVTFRAPLLLAKMVATLDVLSGGRAFCGLGAGWYEREHRLYGLDFPGAGERLDRLEEALVALRLAWGPGSPSAVYGGSDLTAIGYPRPLQARLPVIVGGGGERRTLALAAKYADACNFGSAPAKLAGRIEALRKHCAASGRDPEEVAVTVLDSTIVGSDRDRVAQLVEVHRPRRQSAASYSAAIHAGTIDQQIGRYRLLAEAGVSAAFVSMVDLAGPEQVERFRPIVEAFA